MMLRSRRRTSYALRALCFACSIAAFGCATKVSAPPEPPVAVRLGDAAFEADEYERAIHDYRLYLDDVEHGMYTPRAFYKSALSAYLLEDYAGTLAMIDELEKRYPGGAWVQVSALRGDALRELGKGGDAVAAWDRAWGMADDIERPKLRSRVAGVLAGLDAAQLRELRGDVRSSEVRALIDREIANRTPPAIEEPIPPVAAVAEVEPAAEAAPLPAEEKAPGTLVGALREWAAEPEEPKQPEASATAADVAPAPVAAEEPDEERQAEEVVLAPEPAVAVAPAPVVAEPAEGTARLVKIERPLDVESAQQPAAEDAPQPDADGVVRLQRIAYPGAEPQPAPSVDSLEKLDVPADAGSGR